MIQDVEDSRAIMRSFVERSNAVVRDKNSQLSSSQQQVALLESSARQAQDRIADRDSQISSLSQQLSALQQELLLATQRHGADLDALRRESAMERREVEASVALLEREKASFARELALLQDSLQRANAQVISLKDSLSQQSTLTIGLEADYRAVKVRYEHSQETLVSRDSRIQELEAIVRERNGAVIGMEERVRQEESLRRRLHNTIQELKGNIRVFCRVRPLLAHEIDTHGPANANPMAHISFGNDIEHSTIQLTQTGDSSSLGKSITKTYPFTFDRVFHPSVPQAEVFDEISQLVQSALDGYPVCIFAYGQTGSGKTYTMEGPGAPAARMQSPRDMGMIPRTAQQIYTTARALKEKGWDYRMEGQFVEIYNEAVYDLLGEPDSTTSNIPTARPTGSGGKRCEIKHNEKSKTTVVEGALTVEVTSPEMVIKLLQRAAANRAVAATHCNDRSSRSHSVFILRLHGRNEASGEVCEGVLNLIDLAGSERLSVSGSTGDRLKETQAINKSLSSLGDVIQALANKEAHIPYRHSRLTFLLQNSLGGNSKTLMFVNVSPQPSSFQESLCSLRFATKVNSCQIGTAKRQVKS